MRKNRVERCDFCGVFLNDRRRNSLLSRARSSYSLPEQTAPSDFIRKKIEESAVQDYEINECPELDYLKK